jgi:hypothetical protein
MNLIAINTVGCNRCCKVIKIYTEREQHRYDSCGMCEECEQIELGIMYASLSKPSIGVTDLRINKISESLELISTVLEDIAEILKRGKFSDTR